MCTASPFRRPLLLTLAVLAALVPWGAPRAAETILRKNDKPVAGDVAAVSKTEVTVKVRGAKEETLAIPANAVISIAWSGEASDAGLARSDEAGGRFQKAIDGFKKALQAGKSSNPLAKTELEYMIVRAQARQALAEPSGLDAAIKALDEFRAKDHYRHFEAVELLGQLYLARKDFVQAQTAFDALGRAPWKETKLSAKVALGRVHEAQGKFDDAMAAFEAVINDSAEGPLQEAQRQAAMLAKARVLLVRKNADEALKLLAAIAEQADADDHHLLAEVYLRKGDCLREKGQDKDAVLAYLYVELLFSSERAAHSEALFQLARLWEKIGQKTRAEDAKARLEREHPGSAWLAQLKAPAE
jgi:tetratricopeptide (TPR) repeat protein